MTLKECGQIEDPTLSFERDGLPGPVAAFALEEAWKASSDARYVNPPFISSLIVHFNPCVDFTQWRDDGPMRTIGSRR